jgi:hypothetical protein
LEEKTGGKREEGFRHELHPWHGGNISGSGNILDEKGIP